MAARSPEIPGARFLRKNVLIFLKFIGPVTSLWVLQPSQIMHMVSTEHLLARALFIRSIKVIGWQQEPRNPGSTIFRKNVLIF